MITMLFALLIVAHIVAFFYYFLEYMQLDRALLSLTPIIGVLVFLYDIWNEGR